MTRDKLIEHVGKAMRAEIVRQYRDDERGKFPLGAAHWEQEIQPELIARVAIEAIEQTGTGCGVCGCLVYALATKREQQ